MNGKILSAEVSRIGQANGVSFYQWNHRLPNGTTVNHQQINSDTYGVQLAVSDRDGYEKYEKIRNEFTVFFENNDLYLDDEVPLDNKSGWFNELRYIEKGSPTHLKRQQQEPPTMPPPTNSTQINIGEVTVKNGNFVAGNDNKVTQKITRETEPSEEKGWLRKEIIISAIAVLVGLVIAYLSYRFGWLG